MRIVRFLWMIPMAAAIGGTLAMAQTPAAKQLRLGTEAANGGNYKQAAQHFRNGVQLEPQTLLARLHLANAYAQEYMAGPRSAHSKELAERTTETFETVLRHAPDNKLALWDLAVFSLASGNPEHGRQLCQKLIQVDPNNARAHYLLGVIDWGISFKPYLETLKEAGLKPPQPGFIRTASLREKYRAAQLPVINEGLQATRKALDLDPDFGWAMVCENLLLREKAVVAENGESYRRITAQADALVSKARVAMEKSRLQPAAAKLDPEAPPPPLPAPPPPPPPPPPSRPKSG
jgi:tetratricopeptide (TPR) repeat protein